jgi:opacity protein-like surface antigen
LPAGGFPGNPEAFALPDAEPDVRQGSAGAGKQYQEDIMKARDQRRWCAALFLTTALPLGLALAVAGAPAQAAEGIYLGLHGGGGVLQDIDDADGFTSEFFPGGAVSGAVGYKWRWLRLEGEILYADFSLDDQTGPDGERPPPPCFFCATEDLSGSISALAFMANAYVDWDLNDRFRLQLGGGVGLARVDATYEFEVTLLGLPTDEDIEVVDDSDSVAAYQAKAGVAYALTERSELYIGYRFFGTEGPSFNREDGGDLDLDGLRAHIGEVGYRFFF